MSGSPYIDRPGGDGRMSRVLRWLPFLGMVVEVVVFVAVGRWIGFGWALLLLVGSGVAGLVALRVVGLSTWRRLREQAVTRGSGAAQAREALAGVGVRILGAMLLILPGFVSSVAGALLLVPPLGRVVGRLIPGTIVTGSLWRAGTRQPGGAGGPDVVEGEVVEVDVEDLDPPDRSAPDFRDAIPPNQDD